MSTVGGGVNIVRDGLVMYLDAANTKSLPNLVTNQFLWSQDFTNVSWIRSRMTTSGSTMAAPYGSSSATTLTATLSYSAIRQNITVPIGIYTVSYYVKYINQQFMTIVHEGIPYGTATFDLINGTTTGIGGTSGFGVSALITAAPNGFYRISVTFNVTQPSFVLAANLWFGAYNGNDNTGSQVYVWGGQFENGSSPTTYLPTTTVPVSNITTWTDISRGGNNGTLVNGPAYNNLNGGSLVFDGVSNYVSVPSLANTSFPQDAGTISVWYNIDSTGQIATNPSIFDGYDGRNHIFIRRTSNPLYTIQVAFQDVSYAYRYVYTHLSTLDVWHNIVVTYVTGISSSVKFYIDGILINSGTISDSAWRPTQQFVGIGTIYANSTVKGKGSILQIYNRALSASEVLQNYNASKSKFGLL